MRIAIVALGSRGDLQPYIALSIGLKRAGHQILLISSENEEAFVKGFNLDFHPLPVNIQAMMDDQRVQSMAKADSPISFFRSHLRSSAQLKRKMVAVQNEIWQACQEVDALVYHPGMANGYFMAKRLGIPGILASYFPMTSTNAFPSILFYGGPRLGGWYNKLTHWVFEQLFWQLSRPSAKAFWRTKDPSVRIPFMPVSRLQLAEGNLLLYGFSENVFPKPADWPKNAVVTGYWPLEAEPNWQPPLALQQFLADGPPPVYIGFGSMTNKAAYQQTMLVVLDAVAMAKQRAVVALGWNVLDADTHLPTTVHVLENAPHAWLFPRMAAVVHHGGAGTTAAGLIAGKPTVIIPHTADQPAWGRRVHELGVGSAPIPYKKLTAETLAAALSAALQPDVVQRAAQLGESLRREQGVIRAVEVIQSYLRVSQTVS